MKDELIEESFIFSICNFIRHYETETMENAELIINSLVKL